MDQTWFVLIAMAFLVVAGFFIYALLEIRKSAMAMTEFLKNAEETIKPAIEDLRETLKSLKKVTDDINGVTEDIRLVSSSARDIGNNLRKISGRMEEVSSEALIKASGLRVGIRTAIEVLLKNLFIRKGEGHER